VFFTSILSTWWWRQIEISSFKEWCYYCYNNNNNYYYYYLLGNIMWTLECELPVWLLGYLLESSRLLMYLSCIFITIYRMLVKTYVDQNFSFPTLMYLFCCFWMLRISCSSLGVFWIKDYIFVNLGSARKFEEWWTYLACQLFETDRRMHVRALCHVIKILRMLTHELFTFLYESQ
jgi:ABC-type amino acid transport system permease subunit